MLKALAFLLAVVAMTAASLPARAVVPVTTILTDPGLPFQPTLTCIAVDSVSNRVFVGDASSNSLVHVIDGSANTVAFTIAVPGPVTSIAVNEATRKLYVGVSVANVVQVYDIANDLPGPIISLNNHRPNDIAVNESTNKVYVAADPGEFIVIDGSSDILTDSVSYGVHLDTLAVDVAGDRIFGGDVAGKVLASINASLSSSTWWSNWRSFWDLAANPSTGYIWGANISENSITRIDPANVANAVQVFASSFPEALAVDYSSDTVFVSFPTEGLLRWYNDVTGWDAGLPAGTSPGAIAVNQATGTVYVCDTNAGAIGVFSYAPTASLAWLSDVFLDGEPDSVAIDVQTNTIYVGDMSDRWVYVIDGSTDSLLTQIDMGGPVTCLAVLPGYGKVYAGVQGIDQNYVKVISGYGNYVSSEMAVGSAPSDMVCDGSSSLAYATTEGSQSVLVIDTNYDTVLQELYYDRPWNSIAFDGDPYPAVIHLTSSQPDTFATYDVSSFSGPHTEGYKDFFKIDFNRVSREVWSTSPISYEISRFDPSDIANTIRSYGTSYAPHEIAVNEELDKAYATIPDGNEVIGASAPADALTDSVIVGNQPRGIAYNPATAKIYVAVSGESKVAVLHETAAQGEQDTTPPVIMSVGYNPFVVDRGGDIVGLYVETTDNVEVTSVIADGHPLTRSWGRQWYADLPSNPLADYGWYIFDVVVRDAAGNETSQASNYLIARTYWAPTSAFFRPTIHGFWASNPIGAYGRVTKVTDQWSFEINDGSSVGSLPVNLPEHELTVGDFVRVSGQLYGNESSPTLYAKPVRLIVEQDVP